jgi:hypothetical protein
MFTPLDCRLRAAECQKMAERAPNPSVRATLEDIARSWNRLAVEAEVMQREKRTGLILVKGSDPSVITGGQ